MPLNKKILLSFFTIFVCFSLDRFSKIYIIKFFIENNYKEYFVNKFLNLILIWNKGIAFGLFQSEDLIYHFISFLILLIIFLVLFFIYNSKSIREIICFSMIAGGALGNIFDRFYYSAVPDFIDLHFGSFHWFTFNVSDICISIGIFLLLIFDIFKFDKKAKKNE